MIPRMHEVTRDLMHDLPLGYAAALLMLAVATVATASLSLGASALLVLSAILLATGAWMAAKPSDRRLLVIGVVAALAVRMLGAAVLHMVLVDRGTGGALFLDDAGYARIAAALAGSWRGQSITLDDWTLISDPSIGNLYVRFAAALVYLFGSGVAIKVGNTALAIATAILVYRTMINLALPYSRAAFVLLLVFPSFVLWSALALKDAYAIAFSAAAIWAPSEILRGGRLLPWLSVTAVALLAIHDVRRYLFVMLCVVLPISMLVAAPRRRKITTTIASGSLAAALLLLTPALGFRIDTNAFGWVNAVRGAMAEGARSAYVEPPPVARATAGAAFRVVVPGVTPSPGNEPRVHRIRPGTQLIVEGASPPPSVSADSVVVRAGDLVLVEAAESAAPGAGGMATGAPATSADRAALDSAGALTVRPERVNVISTPAPAVAPSDQMRLAFEQNIRHMPIGLLFVLTAPSPFTARTATEFALIPEMLLWYVVWLLAAAGLWGLVRDRRYGYAYGTIMGLGIVLVLSLAEGNTGTLVRHRTMLVPFVVVVAAYGAYTLRQTRLARYVPRRFTS